MTKILWVHWKVIWRVFKKFFFVFRVGPQRFQNAAQTFSGFASQVFWIWPRTSEYWLVARILWIRQKCSKYSQQILWIYGRKITCLCSNEYSGFGTKILSIRLEISPKIVLMLSRLIPRVLCILLGSLSDDLKKSFQQSPSKLFGILFFLIRFKKVFSRVQILFWNTQKVSSTWLRNHQNKFQKFV